MDDLLIFLNGGIQDNNTLSEVLHLFFSATRMEINGPKSSITLAAYTPQETCHALLKFPFQRTQIEDVLKYLGFRVKSHGYKIVYWAWLVTKVERRLNDWSHRLLSRACRLVLIKSILEAIPIYWMSLAYISQGILSWIQRLYCHFLWRGHKEGKPFSWVKWSRIAIPKKWGDGVLRISLHFHSN